MVPTYDIETLQEMEGAVPPGGGARSQGGGWASTLRPSSMAAESRNAAVRVGNTKRSNPLEELRSVYRVTSGLKLSRGKFFCTFGGKMCFRLVLTRRRFHRAVFIQDLR